ncbi:hypothetical protein LTR95_008860 [Oleoguttula sp. CCFEE 5521]
MFRKLFARLKDRLTPSPSPVYGCGELFVENGKQVTCGKRDHQCEKCRLAWVEQGSRRAFEEDKQTLNKGLPLKRTTGGKRE